MGKSRRNRSGAANRRPDPINGSGAGQAAAGRPPKAVKEPADPALAALRTAKILPVMRDLRSADPKTRTAAAGAVANIVADTRCRKLLLREQVVHLVLSETLGDASIESRAAGWSVLNELAQHEAADFCVHLYRSDVLTPAAHALSQVRETLARSVNGAHAATGASGAAAHLTKTQQEFMWRIASPILDLVGLLVDAREETMTAVAKNTAIAQPLFVLAAGGSSGSSSGSAAVAVPFEIQWAALTTLTRICEDERSVAEALVDDQVSGGCYGMLRDLQAAGGPLAVAASSLLHAVFTSLEWFDHSQGRDGASDALLVPTLARAIEQQQRAAQEASGDEASEQDISPAEVLGLALQTLATIGTTLKASLEKGNKNEEVWNGIEDGKEGAGKVQNGDAGDDDGDDEDMADGEPAENGARPSAHDGMDLDEDNNDRDGEDDNDDDEMDDEELDRDMENVTGFDANDNGDDAHGAEGLEDLATLHALIDDAIPQIVRLIAARADDADEDAVAVLLDALAALNNIAWTVSLVDLRDEGNAAIRDAWTPVARRVWLKVVRPLLARDLVDLAVAAQVTGLAWALSRVLGGATPTDAGEPARFMALRDAAGGGEKTGKEDGAGDGPKDGPEDADGDPFQGLPVKCIGVLGQMALDPAPVDLNRTIGKYLAGVVASLTGSPPAAPADVVEALNQLFDIYGDEKAACDKEVFWANGMLPVLEAAVPWVKAMAKSIDKRRMGELRMRADEAVLNLGRFIQYKKKHRVVTVEADSSLVGLWVTAKKD